MARRRQDALVFRETNDFASMRRLALNSGLEESAHSDFVKAFGFYRGQDLVGCAGLKIQRGVFTVECVAVAEPLRGRGIGRVLVRRIEEEAKLKGAGKIWAIARTPEFFEAIGYSKTESDELEGPTLTGCISCKQYKRTCEPAIVVKIL